MRWIDPPPAPQSSPLLDLHPLVGQALVRRGIATREAATAFLDPGSYRPAPASDLPGMEAAVARVAAAIHGREPICVWGDFDVDGQTATAILVSTFRALGGDVVYHVPVRASESHGVNRPRLDEIIDHGARLVVTCDTGITSHEAVEHANSRNVDMVITDHHDLGDTIPSAAAVTDPKLLAPGHPLASLPGAGVAYKMAEALLAAHPGLPLASDELLDLAVLGIIGDLALLRGDTRYLAQLGLEQLRRTERRGLAVMMELAQIVPANLNEEHVGFELAPRLNALGRLGDANPAVELLLTSDPARARVIATQLEGLNAQRKLLSEQVYQAAEAQLRNDPSLLAQPIIILEHAHWHGGVIGIVASRLARRYGKPAILFTSGDNGLARGSARSIEGLQITEAIAAQRDILHSFGGHPMAAGLSLDAEKVSQFRKQISSTVDKMLEEAQMDEAALQIDGWVDLPEITLDLAAQIECLAPFGPGNEELVLATRNVVLKSSTQVGRNKDHLKMMVEDSAGNEQTVLWWGGGGEPLPEGPFDLAYTLRASDFRGTPQLAVEFVDVRESENARVEIERARREVKDWRAEEGKERKLAELRARGDSQVLIWAEGTSQKAVQGLGRQELTESETLVIWSAPPSQEVLSEALERVRPGSVILVGVDPGSDDAKAFIERLLGLVKFAINRKGGRTTLEELAAATAERKAAVILGLDYLAKRGLVTVEPDPAGQILLAAARRGEDEAAAEQIRVQVEVILRETAAYRAYFARAERPVE